MENLNQNGMQELTAGELQTIDGGFILRVLAQAGVVLLINEWESTKKAAVDLWNFEFNPPQ
jgi:hypothetical protein